MTRPRIAIVNSSSFGRIETSHIERLEAFADLTRIQVPATISPDDFAPQLEAFDGIIASVSPRYPGEVLERLPRLRAIARHGIGCDNIDLAVATKLGILVTKVAGPVEREAVAEQAVALLLTVARWSIEGGDAARTGRWADRARFVGIELRNRVIGVIGVGNIGSRVAEILRAGFQAEVLAVDPAVSPDKMREFGAKSATLEEIIARSDVISLNCSLNPTSLNILDAARLKATRRGVIIVNTARGELIDEEALGEGLKSGHIRAYATDVVKGEPDITENHPFFSLPNLLLVPHLGAYTVESLVQMGDKMVCDMETVLSGKGTPEVIANPEVLESPKLRI